MALILSIERLDGSNVEAEPVSKPLELELPPKKPGGGGGIGPDGAGACYDEPP